jgi:hypothetical protein
VAAPDKPHARIWGAYGDDPLPAPAVALERPLWAFPSWFLRIECERCGKVQLINESHMPRRHLPLRTIIDRMRHDGCGGKPAKVELLTGVESASYAPSEAVLAGLAATAGCRQQPGRPGPGRCDHSRRLCPRPNADTG